MHSTCMPTKVQNYNQVRVEPKNWKRLRLVKREKFNRLSLTQIANQAIEVGTAVLLLGQPPEKTNHGQTTN